VGKSKNFFKTKLGNLIFFYFFLIEKVYMKCFTVFINRGITMTIINFKVDEDKKKKIEEIVELKGYKSVSEFIREAIDDKMNLQKVVDDFLDKNPSLDRDKIKIPDFIPDGKYLGIARNEIVVTGDTIQEVMKILYEKFPEAATAILRKGKKIESFETLFSLFNAKNTKCYHQTEIENNFYPILRIDVEIDGEYQPILGLVDTGATIMALDKNLFQGKELTVIRTSEILTANGITNMPIYNTKFKYENKTLGLDFTITEFSRLLTIQALIGKNYIDRFNLMFLGNNKLFCLQPL